MTTIKSKLGFHCGPGGNKNGLGNWETSLNSQGIPFFLKSVDEYGVLNEAVNIGNQYSISNILVYRISSAVSGFREVPNYEVNPEVDAINFVNGYLNFLPMEFNRHKVILELINEPRTKNNPGDVMYNNMNAMDYLGVWSKSAAVYCNNLGFKVCLPSFNSGEPPEEYYAQPGWLDFLKYCAENPSNCFVSLHEYAFGWNENTYPHLFGRFERIIAGADLNSIPRSFKIVVTEWGGNYNDAPVYPNCKVFWDQYNNIIARFPEVVLGFAAWTLQMGFGNIDNEVQSWISPSISYNKDATFNSGTQPHPTFLGTLPNNSPPNNDCRGNPRRQYRRVVYLLNPLQDNLWVHPIVDALKADRVTTGFSIDDAMIGDLDDREVIVINGDDWDEFLYK